MKKNNKRLTSAKFLTLYQQIIQNNGVIHLKTDSNFLFNYTLAVLKLNNLTVNTVTDDLYSSVTDNESLHIQTHYEKLWRSKNIKIKYIQFQCNNTITLAEPDVDIEKDNYKSTGWK
jgi:tRNA (guanine-N7-)-methyltransferase